MKGESLPEADHVARYCRPSAVDHGVPTVTAFEIGPHEDHLSVNWLEYFRPQGAADRTAQVQRIRKAFAEKGYVLRGNGRFAVFNVGESADNVRAVRDLPQEISHWPQADDDSHAGVFGYGPDDLAVALELKNMIAERDVIPAVGQPA